jgi:uncharacterized membrane protein
VLQAVHSRGMIRDARRLGIRLVLLAAVGDYLVPGACVALAYGPPSGTREVSLTRRLLLGTGRLALQDSLLGLRLLVDVACRALSPAINDPTTAVEMLERIGAVLVDMGQRRLGSRWIPDAGGQPRVCIPMPTWDDLLTLSVAEITEYSVGAPQVRRRLRSMLHELEDELPPSRHPAIQPHLQALDEPSARDEFSNGADHQGIGLSRPELS